ncbi:MAG TPA: hypothetical protein DDX54_07150 [Rhodospirillaceae bacterium]|nr:hypothetical protein [Alphaproteobacteria bacterium]HBH27150.1 hypothetical protein [Rhodospirillaceae bacterium]
MDVHHTEAALREAERYKSPSQRARVLFEGWALNNAFCPQCGGGPGSRPSGGKSSGLHLPSMRTGL